jgi:hypothetical protein
MMRRKRIDDDRNRGPIVAPGRVWRVPVFLARWLSGVKVARARFGRWYGTWEPLAAMGPVGMLSRMGVRENPKQLICQGESTDAWQGDGPPRSSGEAPVIGAERRGRVVLIRVAGQPECPGGA